MDKKEKKPLTKKQSMMIGIATIVVIILTGVAVLALAQVMNPGEEPAAVEDPDTVYFFYGEGCPHCENVMPLVLRLQKDYPKVNFRILETWKNQTNAALSAQLMADRGQNNIGVPLIIVGPVILLGDKQIPLYLEGIVANISIEKSQSETNWFKR